MTDTQAASQTEGDARSVSIRRATAADAEAIAAIYRPFVTDNAVSFEFAPPDATTMAERIDATNAHWCWLVAEVDGRCMGYAYGNQFRTREAYRWTVETSAYMAPDSQRLGIARRLYRALFDALAAQGYCRAIAAIALPNPASLRFHERLGFEEIGVLRQVGYKFGRWHDVAYYQRSLRALPADPPPDGA